MSINLSTTVGAVSLNSCIYNASGPKCTTKEELENIGKSFSAAILTKSSTLELRTGNPSPRYFENELGSINSMGLPNQGYQFYADLATSMQQYNKPYFISVAGLSLENNLVMLKHLNQVDNIDAIELNLSCPNVPGKPQTGYDFERTQQVLDQVCKFDRHSLGIKLPPYFDLIHFRQMADIINQYPIKFVTCVNSIGNGLVIDVNTEQVVIKPKNGFGGVGGDYIKPTALANVRQFYLLLRDDIDIIGSGGAKNGSDVFEHILCGASAVQIGTQYMREGANCFERIEKELKNLMAQKNYQSIDDFKGKLQSIS
ncbi:dihydroorotate oxidase [Aureispira anguillae]|uniref:dihydroorotate oxidase (fumarate) n=1 Tax=Aureispira anguillae TaxID=2864201 RepID=A0A915VMP9_9BACT|nr:dihydroorotate oxidase [Aureispira anguillae]BDS09489.1 dihydroorotate oxidase [Aureispira anguillae]